MEPLKAEQVRNQYLNQDRSVNIQESLKQQEKLQEGGLEGVDIRGGAKNLGKDDFLKLLITQLSHQDPTQPVTDQQFIAQMAQFSSLEQMQNISSGISKMSERQAYNLVGRFVVGKDFATGEMTSGIAKALFYDNGGQAFLKVGGRAVSLNDITLVGDPESFRREFGGLGQEQAVKRQPGVSLPTEGVVPHETQTSPGSSSAKPPEKIPPAVPPGARDPAVPDLSHTMDEKAKVPDHPQNPAGEPGKGDSSSLKAAPDAGENHQVPGQKAEHEEDRKIEKINLRSRNGIDRDYGGIRERELSYIV